MNWAEFFCWYVLVGVVLCAIFQRRCGNADHWTRYVTMVIAWPAVIINMALPEDL